MPFLALALSWLAIARSDGHFWRQCYSSEDCRSQDQEAVCEAAKFCIDGNVCKFKSDCVDSSQCTAGHKICNRNISRVCSTDTDCVGSCDVVKVCSCRSGYRGAFCEVFTNATQDSNNMSEQPGEGCSALSDDKTACITCYDERAVVSGYACVCTSGYEDADPNPTAQRCVLLDGPTKATIAVARVEGTLIGVAVSMFGLGGFLGTRRLVSDADKGSNKKRKTNQGAERISAETDETLSTHSNDDSGRAATIAPETDMYRLSVPSLSAGLEKPSTFFPPPTSPVDRMWTDERVQQLFLERAVGQSSPSKEKELLDLLQSLLVPHNGSSGRYSDDFPLDFDGTSSLAMTEGDYLRLPKLMRGPPSLMLGRISDNADFDALSSIPSTSLVSVDTGTQLEMAPSKLTSESLPHAHHRRSQSDFAVLIGASARNRESRTFSQDSDDSQDLDVFNRDSSPISPIIDHEILEDHEGVGGTKACWKDYEEYSKRKQPNVQTASPVVEEEEDEEDLSPGHSPAEIVSSPGNQNRKKASSKFACPERGCGQSFPTRFSLKRHQKRHTGERPFECDVPDCNRRFAEKSTLDRHIRTHTGEKPYSCPLCKRKFADRVNMLKHERNHGQPGDTSSESQ